MVIFDYEYELGEGGRKYWWIGSIEATDEDEPDTNEIYEQLGAQILEDIIP